MQRNPIHRFKLWSRRNPLLAPSLVGSILLAIGLVVVGVLALAADVGRSRAQGKLLQAELVQAEHRDRQHQREILIHRMQRMRLSAHDAGWSEEAWRILAKAKALDVGGNGDNVDQPLQSNAIASLLGLDARRTKLFQDFGALSLAYDPKGERLLMGGVLNENRQALSAKIWDERLLSPRALPAGGSGPVGFRSDGTPIQLAFHAGREGQPDRLELIELEKGRLAVAFPLPESGKLVIEDGDPLGLGMSAEGALVAALVKQGHGPLMLHVWDGRAGKLVRRLEFAARCTAFSPDRSFVAAGNGDGRVQVWSVRTGQPVAWFSQGRMPVQSLAFGRNPLTGSTETQAEQGHEWLLAAGDRGATINIYDVGARKLLEICRGSHYSVSQIAFSPDGATLASANPGSANLWDVATGRLLLSLPGAYSFGVTFSPDGKRLVVGGSEGDGRPSSGLATWDLDNGHGIKTLRGLTGTVEKTVFSRDGRFVAATSQEWQVAVWDLQSGSLLHVFNAPRGEFIDNASLAFSPDGRLLAFSGGNEARMWHVATGQEQKHWSFDPGFMDTLAFAGADQLLLLRMETKNGRALPYGTDPETNPRVVRIRDLLGPDPKRPLREIEDFNWRGHGVAATPDGRIFVVEGIDKASGKLSRLVNAYEGATGKKLWSIPTSRSPDVSAELSIDPSGSCVSFRAGKKGTPTLVDATSGRFLRILDSLPQCLGPEAKFWVSRTEGPLRPAQGFFGIEEGRDHSLFKVEFDTFQPCILSPKVSLDGRYLGWGNADGSVIVCDLKEVNRRLSEVKLGW